MLYMVKTELVHSSVLFLAVWCSLASGLPVPFLSSFLPKLWRGEFCLQAGRLELWFHLCCQLALCDLGQLFSILLASISLLNGKQLNGQKAQGKDDWAKSPLSPLSFYYSTAVLPWGTPASLLSGLAFLRQSRILRICTSHSLAHLTSSIFYLPTPRPDSPLQDNK